MRTLQTPNQVSNQEDLSSNNENLEMDQSTHLFSQQSQSCQKEIYTSSDQKRRDNEQKASIQVKNSIFNPPLNLFKGQSDEKEPSQEENKNYQFKPPWIKKPKKQQSTPQQTSDKIQGLVIESKEYSYKNNGEVINEETFEVSPKENQKVNYVKNPLKFKNKTPGNPNNDTNNEVN